jgi:3-deoxy-D-manno-octulosonic-acid transferase
MLPVFAVSSIVRGKHAAGFFERLGFLPAFTPDDRYVVWIHCVSVGETNAARPLVDAIRDSYPDHRLIISTVTRTGQNLAREIFAARADCVFYVPFDFRWTVRKALRHFKPNVLLLMETELWFNLIRETSKSNARLAIVNGRLSQRSFDRYSKIKTFMKRVLGYLDLALMQENADATRIMGLGLRASKVKVLGNLKFDHDADIRERVLTSELRERYGVTVDAPLVIAASTHAPEEKWILEAFKQVWKSSTDNLPRLMIVPRHPERFADVAEQIKATGFTWARRSEAASDRDLTAEVILLDTIGELRAAYPLAEIVFVGGSLIPHGGQSIFEPASAGKAIIVGPHTANFAGAVEEFEQKNAIIQMSDADEANIVAELAETFAALLGRNELRHSLGRNALEVMDQNRGTAVRTIEYLAPLLNSR